MYARSAEAVTEDSLRAAFGEFTAGDAKTLKITSLGLLKEDDHVSGTGSAAPARWQEESVPEAELIESLRKSNRYCYYDVPAASQLYSFANT